MRNNKIQQVLLPFQLCFLFWCGRRFHPVCELGKKLTGWKNFICQEEKWNERIFTCLGSGLSPCKAYFIWLARHSLKGCFAIVSPRMGIKDNATPSRALWLANLHRRGNGHYLLEITKWSLPQPAPANPVAVQEACRHGVAVQPCFSTQVDCMSVCPSLLSGSWAGLFAFDSSK